MDPIIQERDMYNDMSIKMGEVKKESYFSGFIIIGTLSCLPSFYPLSY